jgi:hypothetical protein
MDKKKIVKILKRIKNNFIEFLPAIIIFGLVLFSGILTTINTPKYGTIHDLDYFVNLVFGWGFIVMSTTVLSVLLFGCDKNNEI